MADGEQESRDRTNLIIGGALLVAAAVVLIIILGKAGEDQSCALATTGIVTIAEGLTHGHGVSSIMAKGAVAGTVPGACKAVVSTLVEEPEAEAEFELTSLEGESTVSASGFELQESATAPPEPELDLATIGACYRSYGGSEFLYRMCLDGVISPSG